jgi:NADH:ubiquinone oxidoreductase subunit 4 (subunit M)
MLAFVFILPLVAALLCLALNRAAPTRWLGVGAAAALLAAALVLLAARFQSGLPLALLDHTWTALDDRAIRLILRFDALSWPLALLALGGGALALLTLALAIPLTLRGFGGLFSTVVLALLVSIAGLANQELIFLPFAWALVALLAFSALRASGALAGQDAPLIMLLAELLAALVLLGVALAAPNAPGAPATLPILACWTIVGLLALGAPPFHAHVQALAEAPAALSGALLTLGVPLIGGYALIRFVAGQATFLPHAWHVVVTLLGLLTLLVGAAGACGTTSLRRMAGLQFSAQMGLLLIAVAGGPLAVTVAAPAVLANSTLATLACYLAIAILERHTGSDDFAEIVAREALLLPGVIFLVGAAAAAGVPGTSGFWVRRWLFDELVRTSPWAAPLLLAGSALLAGTYVAPLATFWRTAGAATAGERAADGPWRRAATAFVCVAAVAPLLLLGIAPQLAWDSWLSQTRSVLAPDAQLAAPALPGMWSQVAYAAAAVVLVGLPIAAYTGRQRTAMPDSQPQPSSVFGPQALGQSLHGLARLASATGTFAAAWQGLLRLSRVTRRGLALCEQRYYLAGLVIALIVMIMLFIQ